MKKSRWKLPYIHPSFFKKSKCKGKKNIALSNFRNSMITFPYVGRRGYIYNGAWSLTTLFEDSMVGFKIGEFSMTKKFDTQLQKKRKTRRKTKNKK